MTTITIRALTTGVPFDQLDPAGWKRLEQLYREADALFPRYDMTIRTRRIVLPRLCPDSGIDGVRLRAMLRMIRQKGEGCGVRWFCLPVSLEDGWGADDLRRMGPELLRDEPSLFLHYLLAQKGTVYTPAFLASAQTILDISRLSNNGFDNFRVGAGAEIVPNTPFFPFTYHEGNAGFSLAVESLGPLLDMLDTAPGNRNGTPQAVLEDILPRFAEICSVVDSAGRQLEAAVEGAFVYKGLDISLAPYPDDRHSIALLMERLGLGVFGGMGTTACTASLTDLLKRALAQSGARATGFNGVMFSPLEDRGMARRIEEGHFQPEHIMLYSTVCGCGVDMLPLEGDTRAESLAALFLDVCTLAQRHRKPLGVRVLPIPGKRLNMLTHFNHDFLVNCRIMRIHGSQGSLV